MSDRAGDAQASAFERALPTAAGGAGGVTLGFGAGFLFDAMIDRPAGSALALLCAMPAAIAAAILGWMAHERAGAARRARDGSVAAARHAWAEVQAWQHDLQGLDAVVPDLAADLDQAKQRLAAIVARHPEVTGLGLLPP